LFFFCFFGAGWWKKNEWIDRSIDFFVFIGWDSIFRSFCAKIERIRAFFKWKIGQNAIFQSPFFLTRREYVKKKKTQKCSKMPQKRSNLLKSALKCLKMPQICSNLLKNAQMRQNYHKMCYFFQQCGACVADFDGRHARAAAGVGHGNGGPGVRFSSFFFVFFIWNRWVLMRKSAFFVWKSVFFV
jgi:hypothetical protein